MLAKPQSLPSDNNYSNNDPYIMDPLLFMIIINVKDALVRKMLAQQCPFQRAVVKAKRTYLFSKWSSYKHKDYNF